MAIKPGVCQHLLQHCGYLVTGSVFSIGNPVGSWRLNSLDPVKGILVKSQISYDTFGGQGAFYRAVFSRSDLLNVKVDRVEPRLKQPYCLQTKTRGPFPKRAASGFSGALCSGLFSQVLSSLLETVFDELDLKSFQMVSVFFVSTNVVVKMPT